jgi:hypothetical protein
VIESCPVADIGFWCCRSYEIWSQGQFSSVQNRCHCASSVYEMVPSSETERGKAISVP